MNCSFAQAFPDAPDYPPQMSEMHLSDVKKDEIRRFCKTSLNSATE